MAFIKATKRKAKLRMSIHGPSGSGKTRSALEIARGLGAKIALLDTESGSASKYADIVDFDVEEVTGNYHPKHAIRVMEEAAAGGYDVLIIDSLSHFWNGMGGFLELVDEEVKKQRARGAKGDSFAAWKEIDPIYRRLIGAILACPTHVIVTMRAKQEYVKEQDDRGKTSIRKVGMAPEMRDAAQYEFDVEGMLDIDHNLVIGKTRCDELDGKVFHKPGREVADILNRWLSDGAPAADAPPPAPKAQEPRRATSKTTVAREAPAVAAGATAESSAAQVEPVDLATEALADDLKTSIVDARDGESVSRVMTTAMALPVALRESVLVAGCVKAVELAASVSEVDVIYNVAKGHVSSGNITADAAKKRIAPAIAARKADLSQSSAAA
jgi:hypothetical protein